MPLRRISNWALYRCRHCFYLHAQYISNFKLNWAWAAIDRVEGPGTVTTPIVSTWYKWWQLPLLSSWFARYNTQYHSLRLSTLVGLSGLVRAYPQWLDLTYSNAGNGACYFEECQTPWCNPSGIARRYLDNRFTYSDCQNEISGNHPPSPSSRLTGSNNMTIRSITDATVFHY